ncbi:MAG TPA: hypothetical protein VIL13_02765, partial [Longimicrobiales bacterium]
EAAFQRVLRLDPENLVALRALGDLARRAGRLREALDYYEQLYARDPSSAELEAIIRELADAIRSAEDAVRSAEDAVAPEHGIVVGSAVVGAEQAAAAVQAAAEGTAAPQAEAEATTASFAGPEPAARAEESVAARAAAVDAASTAAEGAAREEGEAAHHAMPAAWFAATGGLEAAPAVAAEAVEEPRTVEEVEAAGGDGPAGVAEPAPWAVAAAEGGADLAEAPAPPPVADEALPAAEPGPGALESGAAATATAVGPHHAGPSVTPGAVSGVAPTEAAPEPEAFAAAQDAGADAADAGLPEARADAGAGAASAADAGSADEVFEELDIEVGALTDLPPGSHTLIFEDDYLDPESATIPLEAWTPLTEEEVQQEPAAVGAGATEPDAGSTGGAEADAAAAAEHADDVQAGPREGVEAWPAAAEAVEARPHAMDVVETQAFAAEPVETQPFATEPAGTQPFATEPVAAGPLAAEPAEVRTPELAGAVAEPTDAGVEPVAAEQSPAEPWAETVGVAASAEPEGASDASGPMAGIGDASAAALVAEASDAAATPVIEPGDAGVVTPVAEADAAVAWRPVAEPEAAGVAIPAVEAGEIRHATPVVEAGAAGAAAHVAEVGAAGAGAPPVAGAGDAAPSPPAGMVAGRGGYPAGDDTGVGAASWEAGGVDEGAGLAAAALASEPAAKRVERAREAPGDEVVTETLAELYLSQGLVDRAVALYRQLVATRPGDARLEARLREAEARLASGAGTESGSGWEVVEAAWSAPVAMGGARVEEVEAMWTGGEGAPVAGVSPYAWPEQGQAEVEGVPGEPTVGEYLARLLNWKPRAQAEAEEGEAATENAAAQEVQPHGVSAASGAAAERREADDDDDDLEMFRAWLQSLKR